MKRAPSLVTFGGRSSIKDAPAPAALEDQPAMSDGKHRSYVRIALSEPLRIELARMARDAKKTEDEIVENGIRSLLQAQRHPAIPRFARRLGPLVPDDDPSVA